MAGKRSRIEDKTSRTAQYTCVTRAASFAEKREAYKGPDDIAFRLVPGFLRLLLKMPLMIRLFARFASPRGIYEYVIARTRFLDSLFQSALTEGFDQMVIFGAGFDSRAQRFQDINEGTLIFELDAAKTQEEKRKALIKKGIRIPPDLVFVPLDFNRQSLDVALNTAGYLTGVKSFYLMEGITMYLTEEAVESTFQFISRTAGPGSRIAFDFVWAGVSENPGGYYGAKEIIKSVSKAGEPWTYFLSEEGIERLLSEHGFTLKELLDAAELEKRYFPASQSQVPTQPLGIVNATHGLVLGEKECPSTQ